MAERLRVSRASHRYGPEFEIQSVSWKSYPTAERNIAILRLSRPLLVSVARRLRPADSPIRLGCQSGSRESVTALNATLYTCVDTCVPGKGSFQRQRGKSARDAFREAQFLRERHSSRLRSVSFTSSRRRFFAKSDLCSDVSCSSLRPSRCPLFVAEGERKRSLKMRPGLRRAAATRDEDQQEGGSNEAI